MNYQMINVLGSMLRPSSFVLCLILGNASVLSGAQLPTSGTIIKMEPFFISQDSIPWRYVTAPGYEVLSHYGDSDSRKFLSELDCALQLLHTLIPEKLLARYDVPRLIILTGPEMMSPISQQILVSRSNFGIPDGSNRQTSSMPNVILADSDRAVSLIDLSNENIDSIAKLMINPGEVRASLEARLPRLPAWFVTGMTDLYNELYTAHQEADMESNDVDPGEDDRIHHSAYHYLIPPLTWISSAQTKKVRHNLHAFCEEGQDPHALMSDLLLHEPSVGSEDWNLWRARSTLLVRWAIDGKQRPRADAFLNLVAAAAAAGSLTEPMLQKHLGLDYREMAARLNDYLPKEVVSSIDLRVDNLKPEWKLEFRNATRTEIARIEGDWERLALGNVKRQYVDSASNYIKTMLTQTYEAGSHDPRLLAVIGLFERNSGDTDQAKIFLASAAQADVVGPRVYTELARIRFGEVSHIDGSPLSAADTQYVIEPLEAGSKQWPPQHGNYALALKVFGNTELILGDRERELLESGLSLFPTDLGLLYDIASLSIFQNDRSKNAALADRGLRLSTTDEDRIRFAKLKERLLEKIQ
jgi:hypothetical protein